MALTQNSLCDWDDIVTLFTNLNTERTRFGYSKLTVPSNTGVAMNPSVISTLKNGIADLQSNSFVGPMYADVNGITVPSRGDLVKSIPITNMNSVVNDIRNVRIYSSNFSGFRGAVFSFGTNFSRVFNTDFSNVRQSSFFFGAFNSNFGNFSCFSNRPSFTSDFSGDYNSNDDYVSSIKSGGNF